MWTIRRKLCLLFSGVVIFSTLAVGIRSYQVAQKTLENRLSQALERQAMSVADQLDRLLYERYQNVRDWASDPVMLHAITPEGQQKVSAFLTAIKEKYSVYSDLIFTDTTGHVIASSNPKLMGQNFSSMSWFKEALQHSSAQIGEFSSSSLGYTVPFAMSVQAEAVVDTPMGINGAVEEVKGIDAFGQVQKIGVLATFLNWSQIISLVNTMPILDAYEQNAEAYAMLIDANGFAITQPYFEKSAIIMHENLIEQGLQSAKLAATGKHGSLIEKGREGTGMLTGFAATKGFQDLKSFGWSVLVFEDKSRALAPVLALKKQISVIGMAVAGIMALLSLLFAGGITHPLIKLVQATETVAGGDLSKRVDIASRDEIGALADSFNRMTDNLEKAKNELVASKDYTDSIIKSTLDAIIVANNHGKIAICNPAALKILGYQNGELLGKSVITLFDEEDLKQAGLLESLQKGFASDIEMNYKTKDGQLVPVLVSATIMRDKNGVALGIVLAAKDIREYKNLEEQFIQVQKMEAVGRLAGGISHDFNHLLQVIVIMGEKIKMRLTKDSPMHEDVEQILSASKSSAKLIRQLLSFSRKSDNKPIPMTLNELVDGIDKVLKVMAGPEIKIEMDLAEKPQLIEADPGQLEQVLSNLVANARDAMPDGGKITLQTSSVVVTEKNKAEYPAELAVGKYEVLSVKDTGTGMPEEVKKKIFEPFFTTKERGKGTGLGLATSYGAVKQAGGLIQVESEVGKGTTFHIYFPQADKAANTLPKAA